VAKIHFLFFGRKGSVCRAKIKKKRDLFLDE